MKKYILLVLILSLGASVFGQKKVQTDTIKVYGNCGMCEERIENACDVIGVKRASWSDKTEMLTITYKPSRISIEEIHQLCADVGHSTSKVKANQEAYNNLHHCCKYVEHDHEGEHEHEHETEEEGHADH
ncbi:heavy-metal-associated domain-containing protein [Parvicella tangerina]|uniref:ATPase n=1 Tax=Parvicella tangerina TaxID=2829795 RepID=A0A916JIU3_9FLAO|nr:metal transporter [Parvicella tangerina]CAG5077084.1 hypothetical protein CRYO30217_00286 [Parvicella tangerina]